MESFGSFVWLSLCIETLWIKKKKQNKTKNKKNKTKQNKKKHQNRFQNFILALFTEFSLDPFSFGEGNENKGNKVFLRNATATVECDVLPYWSNVNKITCDTR